MDQLTPGANEPRRLRQALARLPLFAELSAAQLDSLAAASRSLSFDAQDFLFRAGQPIGYAHLLIGGSVKRSTLLTPDTEKVIELAQAPQILSLGEIFAADVYASSCEAITFATVVAIDIESLRTLIRGDAAFGWRMVGALAARQYAMEFDPTGANSGATGTQRVLDFLLGLAGNRLGLAGETTVTLKTSKKTIASRVGLTPESFSRSLRQLSDSGVIVVDGRQVHIQHAALLDTEVGSNNPRLSFPRKARASGEPAARPLSPGSLVNLCGRPRMLSQRMAIHWALIGRDITPAKAAVGLRQLKVQFERLLDQLDSLGLPPTFTERLAEVTALWADYQQALFAAAPEKSGASLVLECSEQILQAIDRLTGEAEKLAKLPAGRDVNIAGRNRMLSQRLGKLFLFRGWGLDDAALTQWLDESLAEFDANLARLKLSGAGVPELVAQLDEVATHWQKFRRALSAAPASSASATDQVTAVLAEGERLFRHVDTVVKLYERLAK